MKIRGCCDPSSLLSTEVRYALFYDSLSLLGPGVAKAQPTPCAALPAKAPIPTAGTSQNPNRAAITAAQNSPDLAAKKLQFAQALAKMESDPNVKAQRAKTQKLMSDHANSAEFQKKKQQAAAQATAAQNSSAFQNKKTAFLASLKCATP